MGTTLTVKGQVNIPKHIRDALGLKAGMLVDTNVLGDFFIGAHAAVSGLPILTRDTKRYASYFSSVRLLSPGT